MKKYLTTTAIAAGLMSSPAFANSNQTDIEQILDGVQTALNAIYATDGGSNVDQSATNAGNIISVDGESLDDVYQGVGRAMQYARNYLNDGPGAGWDRIEQAATNVLNSLTHSGDVSVEDVTQRVRGVRQISENMVYFDGDSSRIDQAATNAANIISGEDLTNDVNQNARRLMQSADNYLKGDDYRDDLDKASQAATNVVNSVSMADVDDINQRVSRTRQYATNEIHLHDDLGSKINKPNTQDAVNAANIVSIDSGDDISSAISDSTQWAKNDVNGLRGYNDTINKLNQSATNVANSLTVENSIDDLTQTAFDLGQVAMNSVDYDVSVDKLDQSAVNAANIASLGNDTLGDVTQISSDMNQTAMNSVDYGAYFSSVEDLTQAATNVINSLSADDLRNGNVFQYTNMFEFREPPEFQYASNFVSFGYGGLTDVTQDATNAANLITLDDDLLAPTWQLAVAVDQTAINEAVPGYYSWGGDIDDLTQNATNAVNILSAGDALPNLAGVQDISQTAVLGTSQFASNSAFTFGGGVNNVAQAAVNVANSISVGGN